MKTLFLPIFCLILTVFIGCTADNEAPTVQWIKSAKKPIVCKKAGSYGWGATVWTLIDADGNVFSTGAVKMTFPDTIKVMK